jgi:hypothetical protein
VLAVVENHELMVGAQRRDEQRESADSGPFLNVQRRGRLLSDLLAVRDGREVDPPDAIERHRRAHGQFARKARFAAAAGSGEREHASALYQTLQLDKLRIATDETGQVHRKIRRKL